MFNFYIDEDRDAHAATVSLFREVSAGKYEAFTSAVVIEELEKAEKDKYDKMLNLIRDYKISVLASNDEAEKLADIYVAEGVIPLRFRNDALHIAIATVNDLDMIVSMNFQHIVKRKTVKRTANINMLNSYHALEIYSPMELVEYESTGHH
jgi:predicted nucleic acid-binding protein